MNELSIRQKIYEIRGQRVMLDFDLADLYQVETRVLNQSVKRNIKRFPADFMFQLNSEEWETISSQFVMTSRAKRPKSALPLAFKGLRQEMNDILADQNDINESTRAQLDAISEALAELQAKEPHQQARRRIGFIQEND